LRGVLADSVRRYLGPARRGDQGTVPTGTPAGEDGIYRAAGFTISRRVAIPARFVTRTADDWTP
jgi:hypothetical protein